MNQITITSLSPEEWRKYKEIRLQALQKEPIAFSSSYEEESKMEDKVWIERLKKSKDNDTQIILFAKDRNRIIGTIVGFWQPKEKIKHVAHIYGLYLDDEFRGKGIGKRLMETIIRQLRGIPQIEKIKIEVNAQNTVAFNLYKKMGFKIIGKAEKEIKINEIYYDEILMEQIIDRKK